MAFTFAAFCYIVALIFSAFLIFFAIWHIIAFDELKTDYKNPIDQVEDSYVFLQIRDIQRVIFR